MKQPAQERLHLLAAQVDDAHVRDVEHAGVAASISASDAAG